MHLLCRSYWMLVFLQLLQEIEGSTYCTGGDAGILGREEAALVLRSDLFGTRGEDMEGRLSSVDDECCIGVEGAVAAAGELVADSLVVCLWELLSRPPAAQTPVAFCPDSVARRGLADEDSERIRPV